MKALFIAFLLGTTLFISCNQNTQKVSEDNLADSALTECYQAATEKDSAAITINNNNGQVTGTIAFNFAEKQNTNGDIKGEFKGDTLFVDYTFTLNNAVSKNPLVFLKQGDKLIQGHGEIQSYLGKTYFTDHSKIKFTDGFVFGLTDCK